MCWRMRVPIDTMLAMKAEPQKPRKPATHVRLNATEVKWIEELHKESGQKWPEIFKTLLREEMRRRKKRGA